MPDFASTAALLANSNKKSAPARTPTVSESASKAALLATNARPPELLKPAERPRAAGKAALLANSNAMPPEMSHPEDHSASSKAAILAHASTARSAPSRESRQAEELAARRESERKALLAATKSFANRRYSEPESALPQASDPQAALVQLRLEARQQESRSRNQDEGNPLPYVSREMYTEHPPLRMEVEETRHQDALHASAVALAQQVYARNQKHESAAAESAPHSGADRIFQQNSMKHLSLQDTAQRLATEKLAKIKDADDSAAFRSYYGYPTEKPKSGHLLRRGHHRSTSDETDGDMDDKERSQRIRSQMTLLEAQIAQVDATKRDSDRKRVREMAERRVQEQMHKLDESIFNKTGNMSPAMMEEWDVKARARIQEQKSHQETQATDMINLGGGKFIDQQDVDAVALARVKPTLDNIDEAVSRKKAAETEERLNKEGKKRREQLEKQQKQDTKLEKKRAQETDKRERKVKHETEKTRTQIENQFDRAQKAEESRLREERRAQVTEYGESSDLTAQDVPKRKRLSLGLLRKDKQSDITESSPQSPRRLKSLVHRLKRRSGAPSADSTSQSGGTIAEFEAMGGTYHEEVSLTAADGRQESHSNVDNDKFEDAKETLSVSDDELTSNDEPSQHRMSFGNRSDSTTPRATRETKFHEVGLQ